MKKNAGWGNLSYVFARGYPYNTTYSGGSPFPPPTPPPRNTLNTAKKFVLSNLYIV